MKILVDLHDWHVETCQAWAKQHGKTLEEYCELHLNQSIAETRTGRA